MIIYVNVHSRPLTSMELCVCSRHVCTSVYVCEDLSSFPGTLQSPPNCSPEFLLSTAAYLSNEIIHVTLPGSASTDSVCVCDVVKYEALTAKRDKMWSMSGQVFPVPAEPSLSASVMMKKTMMFSINPDAPLCIGNLIKILIYALLFVARGVLAAWPQFI